MSNSITTQSNELSKSAQKTLDSIIVESVYAGPQAILDIVKSKYPNLKVSLKDIRNYLMTKKEYQLVFERKQTSESMGKICSFHPFALCQIDIFDLSKFSYSYGQFKKKKVDGLTTNFNKGYKYLFALIDVFSNFADVIPMKNKGIDDTTNALKIILETYNLEPLTLMSDSDSSFLGSKFQNFLKTKDIELDPVIVNDHRSLGKIDRFARTLKTRIMKLFLANGNTNWIDYIADILYSYNNTKNLGILKYTPQQVISDPVAENEVLKLNIEKSKINQQLNEKKQIKAGDKIRVYIDNAFRKKTEPNYTTELFEVKSIKGKKILLTNGKTIRDQNILKIDNIQYIDNNLLTNGEDNIANSNVIDEANKENKITRKLKQVGITRPTYEQLHEPRESRNKRVDYAKLNSGK
jgi:hypothetical protein